MSYSHLYDFVQELTPKIRRRILLEKTLELTGAKPVIPIMTDKLDPTCCRGYFISASNTESRFVQQVGGNNVIVLARDQSDCWKRFVYIKELMHLFDSPEEITGTPDTFEKVLTELSVQDINPTPQTKSETECFWMALAVVCPEKSRLIFEKQRNDKHIDDYGIAVQLKIPEQHVYRLFEANFPIIVKQLTGQSNLKIVKPAIA